MWQNALTTERHTKMNATYNTNENIKVVFNAIIHSGEMTNLVGDAARKMVDTGCPMPEEFDDIFVIDIITRPSGSKYARVQFA